MRPASSLVAPGATREKDGSVSIEPSSRLPGGFQLRHRRLGIFQGTSVGLAFWYPSSGMPEYGLCRFETDAKARAYLEYLCSPTCAEPLDRGDLLVEPFDHAQHEALTSEFPPPSAFEVPF